MAGTPPLDPRIVKDIKDAPDVRTKTHEALARELTEKWQTPVSRGVVRKYRAEARQERQEIVRQHRDEHVAQQVTSALEDLTELRKLAAQEYRAEMDHRQGELWLHTIKLELGISGTEKPSEFAGLTDDDLRDLVREAYGE
jgi:hypothetical protein